MTKSLFNKIRLKERLYTFSMAEGTPIQNHLDEFNSILIDLNSMDVKIEDEDKAIMLVISLPTSYEHFKQILPYGNNETLSFEDVKASLLYKDKFDLEMRGEKNAGYFVGGESFDKINTDKSNFKGRKPNKFYKYCKKRGHLIDKCWNLKDKREKEENHTHIHPHEPGKATFAESDSDGDVLFATSTKKGNNSDWVLDSGCTYHMCPHKDWFFTYDPVNFSVIHMGNNVKCNVAGIGTSQIKTHDSVIRTLSNVCHVPDLKCNLISLGTLESKGCKYSTEGGVLKVFKGSRTLLKSLRYGSLYIL